MIQLRTFVIPTDRQTQRNELGYAEWRNMTGAAIQRLDFECREVVDRRRRLVGLFSPSRFLSWMDGWMDGWLGQQRSFCG